MAEEVAFLAADYLDAYIQAQQWTDIAEHHKESVVWKPPICGKFKVNFEGALFKGQNATGIRVIIRDCHGKPVAALS